MISPAEFEVAGWIVDRKIRVRFPSCPNRVRDLWLAIGNHVIGKDVFGQHGARVGVGSARKRPPAAHGVGAVQQVNIWKLDNCPVAI